MSTHTIEQRAGEANGPAREAAPGVRRWVEEATRVCREAARGNLEVRLLHIDHGHPLAPLLLAINHLLDMTDAFVRESTASLESAAKGRFFRRVMLNGMLGAFRSASRAINGATRQMDERTKELEAARARRRRLGDEFARTLEVVSGLTEASQKIEGLSKVIKSIANQTNLLALNAAVEAARVGDAGRGFAVVAGEVKRLSQQASDATRQIETQLANIHEASRAAMAAITQVRETMTEDTHGT